MRNPAFCHTLYQALTLSERAATLAGGFPSAPAPGREAERAERRFRGWRFQPPFDDGPIFDERLALDGISEDDFRFLLGESAEALRGRVASTPDWLAKINETYSPDAASHSTGEQSDDVRPTINGLLSVAEPLIMSGLKRVREGVEALAREHGDVPFDAAEIVSALFENLSPALFTMLGRTLTLELNVARLREELGGGTPEERFKDFFNQLRRREKALALFEEYPVLARNMVACVNRWSNVSVEFVGRLCADWPAIRETLLPGGAGRVRVVSGGSGDTHRGGRSVTIVGFEGGAKLVYKPRPLSVEVKFQELLTWLNERGGHPPFRTLKILDRGSYGWTEFVSAQPCASADGLRRFYARQGGYLALLYALEATDFHYENLIAAGEHPILIDLESLFQPRAAGLDLASTAQAGAGPMIYSVLRVGLLPQRVWVNGEDMEGIDLSGVSGSGGQLSPNRVPYWADEGTDQMRIARDRLPLPPTQNRPTLGGGEVNVLEYSDALIEGFTSVYRTLLERRDELTREGGWLSRFACDEVRGILRATRVYALLLNESHHPDLLRNALDRDRFFDRLWVGVGQRPDLARVIAAERADLEDGDIPLFTTRPDSRDLWTSRGERIADYFENTGLSLVKSRVLLLSERDLMQQLWFINASLASLSMGEDGAAWASYEITKPGEAAGRGRLLDAARAVGDRLESLALRGEQGDVSWIGLALINQKHWVPMPLGLDLYNGLPGVALFLAYLGYVTGEQRYTTLARETLTTARDYIERSKADVRNVGAFDGWGGTIYALAHLGVLWREPELLAEAESYVELLPALVEQDTKLDIVSGAAGCIAALRALYECHPSARVLDAVGLCGERLIARAERAGRGVGWQTGMASRPLNGFSHGASGIGWALLEASALCGDERFRAVAEDAFAYERGLFSPEEGNWPDLRDQEGAAGDGERPFLTMWCHGAPGVGLARLLSLRHADTPELRREAEAALATTLEQGFGKNHSLCHGDLGNLDVLRQGSRVLGDEALGARVDDITAAVLEGIGANGWLCGVPLGVESPGLMTGLAGIGYGLLRLAEPERVPSVLSLDPPRRCGQ